MAGDAANQLTFHLSGGTLNTDSALSLGGTKAFFPIRNLQYTLAANAAADDTRIFLSGSDPSWIGCAVYFVDGSSAEFSTRVTAVDTIGHSIDLLDPLPSSAAIGDVVWGYDHDASEMPFKATTPLESALGMTHYCALFVVNSGASLPNFRLWLEALDPGPVTHQIAASNDQTLVNIPPIPNESTPPDLSGFVAGGAMGRFIDARTYETASPEDGSFGAGELAFWIKRISPANAIRRSRQRIGIVAQSGAAGTVVSKLILDWDTQGFTPAIELSHAPTVYLRGGARFRALIRAQETGLPVPGVPVGFAISSGPGVLQAPPDPGVTDASGKILARYAAPTDIGEIGQVVTVEAQA